MPDGDIYRPFFSPNERDVGWKIQSIVYIFWPLSIGHGLASPPIRRHLDREVLRLKFTSVFYQVLKMTHDVSDAIFYCDLLCVLLFLLLINTHIVICYVNAGKHVKETR